MEVQKSIGRIILNDAEKSQVIRVAAMQCPGCGKPMKFYNTNASPKPKPEMACHDCKLSAPLW